MSRGGAIYIFNTSLTNTYPPLSPLPADLADLETRRTCADRCASLLHSLGRDEELKALRRLMGALDGAGAGARAGVMM